MSELDDLRQSLRQLGRRLAGGEIDEPTYDRLREKLLADLTPSERAALGTGSPGTPAPGNTPAPLTPLPIGPVGPSGGSGRGMATRLPQLAELKLVKSRILCRSSFRRERLKGLGAG